jgi:pyruvate dehydrogenase phosphatase
MIVNSVHNCDNPSEIQRIQQEHPSEQACVCDNRVIGYLAPTRGISQIEIYYIARPNPETLC